jgi:hypothetical protein
LPYDREKTLEPMAGFRTGDLPITKGVRTPSTPRPAAFWAHPAATPSARGTPIGFSINFVAAGPGQDLVADASVRRRGREICTAEVSVTAAGGRESAVALVTCPRDCSLRVQRARLRTVNPATPRASIASTFGSGVMTRLC